MSYRLKTIGFFAISVAAWIVPSVRSQWVYMDFTKVGNDVHVKTHGSFTDVSYLNWSKSTDFQGATWPTNNNYYRVWYRDDNDFGNTFPYEIVTTGTKPLQRSYFSGSGVGASCNSFGGNFRKGLVASGTVSGINKGIGFRSYGPGQVDIYHEDPPVTAFDQTGVFSGESFSSMGLVDGGSCIVSFQGTSGTQYISVRVGTAVPPPPPPPPPSTDIKGDPHFKTWSGHKYDYHGECDLVFADNPNFANGLGLKIHVRTKIKSIMSYIERVAIQIGNDVFELTNNKDDWTRNGVALIQDQPDGVYQKFSDLGGFRVRLYRKALSIRLDDKLKTRIDFKTRKDSMPSVRVFAEGSDIFDGTLGMVGHWKTGKMVGRDGTTLLEDPSEFAREWQVRPVEDGSLFSELRDPMYPDQCKMPSKKFTKRLGDSHLRAIAEQECAAWKEDKDECVMDVMVTRSIETAREIPSVGVGSHDDEDVEEDDWHDSKDEIVTKQQ